MLLPAIIIPAYNRAYSLERLLRSVAAAKYAHSSIALVISIDKNDNEEVYRLAENFEWPYGVKKIIAQPTHLGLKEHILRCGDLSVEYGAVIILEDDLFVSPCFYDYTLQALGYYGQGEQEANVAGISLFNYEVAENGFGAFEAMPDGTDVYFMQMASSWGQCFTAKQWQNFRTWFSTHDKIMSTENLPDYILGWSESSWKKHFVRYLVATDKYFVFPRVSLSTNFGERGTNTDRRGLFQSALLTFEKKFAFAPLEQSLSVYDAWFEMQAACFKKLNPSFSTCDLALDLYGTKKKSEIQSSFLLSSKPCAKPIKSFGNELRPMLSNIILQNEGTVFCLGATPDFKEAEIDKEIFYPVVASVADMVFYQRIKALSEDRIQKQLEESRYRERFKEITVVVFDRQGSDYRPTLQSVSAQNYPHVQIVFVSAAGKAVAVDDFSAWKTKVFVAHENQTQLLATLKNSSSSLFVLAQAGDVFLPDAFDSANHVFGKFDFIHLLAGLAEVNGVVEPLPRKRLNKNIFAKNLSRADNLLVSASFFFDRFALEKITAGVQGETSPPFTDLFYGLIGAEAFYTTPAVFCKTTRTQTGKPHNTYPLTWSVADSMARFFFENDTTYLRYFFAEWQQLPPVVRYQAHTKTWYLSGY